MVKHQDVALVVAGSTPVSQVMPIRPMAGHCALNAGI